jgi:hypothetical protein
MKFGGRRDLYDHFDILVGRGAGAPRSAIHTVRVAPPRKTPRQAGAQASAPMVEPDGSIGWGFIQPISTSYMADLLLT